MAQINLKRLWEYAYPISVLAETSGVNRDALIDFICDCPTQGTVTLPKGLEGIIGQLERNKNKVPKRRYHPAADTDAFRLLAMLARREAKSLNSQVIEREWGKRSYFYRKTLPNLCRDQFIVKKPKGDNAIYQLSRYGQKWVDIVSERENAKTKEEQNDVKARSGRKRKELSSELKRDDSSYSVAAIYKLLQG